MEGAGAFLLDVDAGEGIVPKAEREGADDDLDFAEGGRGVLHPQVEAQGVADVAQGGEGARAHFGPVLGASDGEGFLALAVDGGFGQGADGGGPVAGGRFEAEDA